MSLLYLFFVVFLSICAIPESNGSDSRYSIEELRHVYAQILDTVENEKKWIQNAVMDMREVLKNPLQPKELSDIDIEKLLNDYFTILTINKVKKDIPEGQAVSDDLISKCINNYRNTIYKNSTIMLIKRNFSLLKKWNVRQADELLKKEHHILNQIESRKIKATDCMKDIGSESLEIWGAIGDCLLELTPIDTQVYEFEKKTKMITQFLNPNLQFQDYRLRIIVPDLFERAYKFVKGCLSKA